MPTASTRELFGGALAAALPDGWLDASSVRPVPDHQECLTELDGERSLVVEILERAAASDADCAAFHFQDISETNDAMQATVVSASEFNANALHPSVRTAGPCFVLHGLQSLPRANNSNVGGGSSSSSSSSTAEADASAAAGDATGPTGRIELSVQMAVLRLPAQATDILVSINRPCAPSCGAEQGLPDAELLLAIVASLEVRDWGLFG